MLLLAVEVNLERRLSHTLLKLISMEGLDTLALISLCAHNFHHLESFRQVLLLERCVWVFGLKDLLDSAFIELGLLLRQMVLITLRFTHGTW